jgi:hypothetical protein
MAYRRGARTKVFAGLWAAIAFALVPAFTSDRVAASEARADDGTRAGAGTQRPVRDTVILNGQLLNTLDGILRDRNASASDKADTRAMLMGLGTMARAMVKAGQPILYVANDVAAPRRTLTDPRMDALFGEGTAASFKKAFDDGAIRTVRVEDMPSTDVWMRDWFVGAKDGLIHRPESPTSGMDKDRTPLHLALAQALGLTPTPFLHDNQGGNFVRGTDRSGKSICVASSTLFTDKRCPAGLACAAANYDVAFGCEVRDIPTAPNEGTKHADVYVNFVDKGTAVVPQISTSHIPAFSNDPERRKAAEEVRKALDAIATRLESHNVTVLRVGMPLIPGYRGGTPPHYLPVVNNFHFGAGKNASVLITQTSAGIKEMLDKELKKARQDPEDEEPRLRARTLQQALSTARQTEATLVDLYSKAGKTPTLVPWCEELLYSDGGVNCTTNLVPWDGVIRPPKPPAPTPTAPPTACEEKEAPLQISN